MTKIAKSAALLLILVLGANCRSQSNDLKQVTVDDTSRISHIFTLVGEAGYSGKVIWSQCLDYIESQPCNLAPSTNQRSAPFMMFRGALVQVLIDAEPDTLYSIYYEILGAIIANGNSSICPQGDGVPDKLKECRSKTYPIKGQEFEYLKKSFEIVEKMQATGNSTAVGNTADSTSSDSTNDQSSSENFVQRHGFLQAKNSRLYDENGDPIRLWGMSLFWSGFDEGAAFYNADVVKTLRNDWNVNLIRAAMQVDEGGRGYKMDRNEKHKIIRVVEAAIDQGIYVIVDWHTYNVVKPEAQEFFSEMAQLYGQVPNVIFEIFNEPVNLEWSANVKPYGQEIVQKIRERNAKNLIIVGTKQYSANPQEAATDKITDQNVAYTLHFYAAEHKEEYRQRALQAMNNGATVFVTEFGTCEANGSGRFDPDETERWIKFMAEKGISWANWSISSKAETCSALKPGANANGNWPDSQLTESGLWIRGRLREQTIERPSAGRTPIQGQNKPIARSDAEGLVGIELLNGIKAIISSDPAIPRTEIEVKPFVGSFSTIKSKEDPNLGNAAYCMTDNACGRNDAYSRSDIPLSELSCNKFCYIDTASKKYRESKMHSIQNPPRQYLSCGWSTCN